MVISLAHWSDFVKHIMHLWCVNTLFCPSEMPEDVNGDGSVNIDDLTFIATRLGHVGAGDAADVNADGVVNILDLVTVAGTME